MVIITPVVAAVAWLILLMPVNLLQHILEQVMVVSAVAVAVVMVLVQIKLVWAVLRILLVAVTEVQAQALQQLLAVLVG
jgi:hypothetical protein